MKHAASRRRQQGLSMFELSLTVAMATGILVAALPRQIEKLEATQAEVSAAQLYTVGDIAQQYRIDRGDWPGVSGSPACNITDVMNELVAQGYLQSALVTTAWGTNLSTTCSAQRFDVSLSAPSSVRAQQAAERLHTATVSGTTITSVFPAGGVPSFDQVLHRVAIPGRPELNQMETALDMTGNDINNVGNINTSNITTQNGTFDAITVRNNSALCAADAANCQVAVNPDGRFIHQNNADGDVLFQMNGANSELMIGSAASGGGHLRVNGSIIAPNAVIQADKGLKWGNQSELSTDQGGAIELGAGNSNAGTGKPYLDFHYSGVSEDYNVRFQNTDNRVLRLRGSGGNLATLIVEGDGIYTNNLQVEGAIGAKDVVSSVSNKSLSQAVQTMFIVPADTVIQKPTYCAEFGLEPRITVAPVAFADGFSTPVYQVDAYALDNGSTWTAKMFLLTDAVSTTSPDPTYNKLQVAIKCERPA